MRAVNVRHRIVPHIHGLAFSNPQRLDECVKYLGAGFAQAKFIRYEYRIKKPGEPCPADKFPGGRGIGKVRKQANPVPAFQSFKYFLCSRDEMAAQE